MLGYQVEDQKRILREMEDDLMALVAIDVQTDDFEVIYTNDAYRHYKTLLDKCVESHIIGYRDDAGGSECIHSCPY
ncbi:MAG: hypothetical protein IJK56_11425 [Firmicutes bacterium]|nr:hypothetical protein [Bacillota bacterium]